MPLHATRDTAAAAGSGEERLTRARALRPDVITLDVAMPRMDGWMALDLRAGGSKYRPHPPPL